MESKSKKYKLTLTLRTEAHAQALRVLAKTLGFVQPKNRHSGGTPEGNLSLLLDALAEASSRDCDGLATVLRPLIKSRGDEA